MTKKNLPVAICITVLVATTLLLCLRVKHLEAELIDSQEMHLKTLKRESDGLERERRRLER